MLYSQYYWFVHFKNQYFSKVGLDGGLDQEAIHFVENFVNELKGRYFIGDIIEVQAHHDCK
jgi:hypothetical protein